MTVTPSALERANAIEQFFCAGRRQNRRRFVEDQHARVGHQGARDFHALLRFHRKVADPAARVHGNVERGEMAAPSSLELATREDGAVPLCPELHRLADRETRRQREALVHEFDARRTRARHAARSHRPALDEHLAGLRPDETGHDPGEGGLARAVLPHHSVDPTGFEAEAHLRERGDGAERDGDASALESGLLHFRHGSAIRVELLKRPGLQSGVERHFQRAGEDGGFGLLDLRPDRLRLGDDIGRALLDEIPATVRSRSLPCRAPWRRDRRPSQRRGCARPRYRATGRSRAPRA